MTESQFTGKLLKELRRQLPENLVVKLNDLMTAGLPDFFVNINGLTTFFEVKLHTNKQLFEPIQYHTLYRLGRGFYIFWVGKEGTIFHVGVETIHSNWKQFPTFTFDELVDEIISTCKTKRY